MECIRGLAMRICPSVRLSVRQTRELWQNGKNTVHIFIPYERTVDDLSIMHTQRAIRQKHDTENTIEMKNREKPAPRNNPFL